MATQKQLIAAAIYKSNLVDNADIDMHADAIIRGDYTLVQLLADAPTFYGFNGYAHEDALMDSM